MDLLIAVRAYKTSERVLIDVKDECRGLPPGKVEELFRPFEQGGADKTGLGLGLPSPPDVRANLSHPANRSECEHASHQRLAARRSPTER
jgi:C4-dicarboxylate-specific signal transduction histidine kinase